MHNNHGLGVDKVEQAFPGYGSSLYDPHCSDRQDPRVVPTQEMKCGSATHREFGEGPLATFTDPMQLDDYSKWPDPDRFDNAYARSCAEAARRWRFAVIGPWVSLCE